MKQINKAITVKVYSRLGNYIETVKRVPVTRFGRLSIKYYKRYYAVTFTSFKTDSGYVIWV